MSSIQKKYNFAVIAADVVLFAVDQGVLKTLLIKMKKKPFQNKWAFPGGLVNANESVDNAAKRLLKDKAGIEKVYLEQLYTFGDVGRDPFGRVVSVAYFALVPHNIVERIHTTKEYADIEWFPVGKLPKLAYDHAQVAKTAINRLKGKLEYTNIVYSLMPHEFTLTDLQTMYEIILHKPLDKRNFRKKILSTGMLKKLSKKRTGLASRPADLFTFKQKSPKIVELI